MKLISKMAMLAIVGSISFASNSALAQFVTQGDISQTGWRLVDLDANDGISAGISFLDVGSRSGSTFVGNDSVGSHYDFQTGQGFEASRSAVSYQNSAASSSFANGELRTLGQLNHAGWVSSFQELNANFVLTPHTRLEYFGLAAGQANNDGHGPAGDDSFRSHMYTIVSGSLTEHGQQGGGVGDDPFNHFFFSTGIGAQAGHNEFSNNFTINYENLTDKELNGKLQLSTYVYGTTPVAAVPEPESYAMMLAGLASLGALSRRRNRQLS